MIFQDILSAIAVVINGLPQGLVALTFEFGALPSALAFLVASGMMVVMGQIAPISFQAESIVLAGTLGKNRSERLNIVFYTGIIMAVIGAFGLLNITIEFIGTAILNGMMAGVGIMLAKVGIDMVKANRFAGGISMAVAALVWFITENLNYTIVISVIGSAVASVIYKRVCKETALTEELNLENERFIPLKLTCNKNIVRSVLSLCTLQIGGNIAYASVTDSLAEGYTTNVDYVTIYSGLGDSLSAFFGGAPVEAVISGTAAAPHPQLSGVLMMLIMATILLLKLLPRIARHVPSEAIAGFLFVPEQSPSSLAILQAPQLASRLPQVSLRLSRRSAILSSVCLLASLPAHSLACSKVCSGVIFSNSEKNELLTHFFLWFFSKEILSLKSYVNNVCLSKAPLMPYGGRGATLWTKGCARYLL